MLTDRDIAPSIGLAVVLLLIIIFVWPGTATRSAELGGYWANLDGGLYSVEPAPGGRGFEVRGRAASESLRGRRRGPGLRTLEVTLPGGGRMLGRLELGGRKIAWDGGEKWVRQGIAPGGRA